MAQESNMLQSVEKEEDRLSDLPDPLIHHIISFLPSTKQAIRTEILSKRWRRQWTHVPALVFDFDSTGMSPRKFLNFVESALILYDSLQIHTFHLQYGRSLYYPCYNKDPLFDEKIRFAATKHVEDLTLSCANCKDECSLPEFLFNYAFLVKLRTGNCSLKPVGKVNWACLKELKLVKCKLSEQAMEDILSGSPLLELFELIDCVKFNKLVISSKSLKNLVLEGLYIHIIKVSCLNLEELSIKRFRFRKGDPLLLDRAIEYVLSNSLLLEFILSECYSLYNPVIASQSLRRLDVSNIRCIKDFEMCCPKLEEMKFWGIINIMNVKLRHVPSSLCASLRFAIFHDSTKENRKSFTEDILQQLQHVKELTIGRWIIETLVDFKVGGPVSSILQIKCLFLDFLSRDAQMYRAACLLRNFPILEKLAVRLFLDDPYEDDELKLDGFGEKYWSRNAIGFDCLVSHLKVVEIYGVPQRDVRPTRMLNFVQFLLNNSRVLESLTIVLVTTWHDTDYTFKACQDLYGFARCSEHATVELRSHGSWSLSPVF